MFSSFFSGGGGGGGGGESSRSGRGKVCNERHYYSMLWDVWERFTEILLHLERGGLLRNPILRYIYIYIYICMYMCVCIYILLFGQFPAWLCFTRYHYMCDWLRQMCDWLRQICDWLRQMCD